MKKTTGLLLCLAIAMGSGTAAADPRGRIAFDDCYIDYWNENPRMWCDIFVTDADGSGAFFAAADGVRPVWSPDGSKIAFMGLGTGHIFVLKLGDGSITRLTSGLNVDWSLAWSPDGSRIAFYRAETGPWGLFVMNADGIGHRACHRRLGTRWASLLGAGRLSHRFQLLPRLPQQRRLHDRARRQRSRPPDERC